MNVLGKFVYGKGWIYRVFYICLNLVIKCFICFSILNCLFVEDYIGYIIYII